MSKPLIFISHITDEQFVAAEIEKMLNDAFLHQFEIFVSSNPNTLRAGSVWGEEIFNKLKEADAGIVVVSPKSKKREWINFEAGAIWGKGVPVIPACHSGLKIDDLDYPLQKLQAVDLTNERSAQNMFNPLANVLGSSLPRYDWTDFINKIRRYSDESTIEKQLLDFIKNVKSVNPDFINLLKNQHSKKYMSEIEARELNQVFSELKEPFANKIKIENLGNIIGDGYGMKIHHKISVNPKLTRKLNELDLL